LFSHLRTTTTSYLVRDPNGHQPTVAIESPVDHPATPGVDETVLTAPTDVVASISDPDGDLQSYRLEVVPVAGGPGKPGVSSGFRRGHLSKPERRERG
jgi:hypothetical protein